MNYIVLKFPYLIFPEMNFSNWSSQLFFDSLNNTESGKENRKADTTIGMEVKRQHIKKDS